MELINKILAFLNYLLDQSVKIGFPLPLTVATGIILIVSKRLRLNWSTREKYYCEILMNLGVWKNSLSERLSYYQQPGADYNDEGYKTTPFYKRFSERALKASSEIRDVQNVAAIFLSKNSNKILQELLSEHYYISEHGAFCTKDYLDQTFKIVDKVNDAILKDAQRDLNRSKYSTMISDIQKGAKS